MGLNRGDGQPDRSPCAVQRGTRLQPQPGAKIGTVQHRGDDPSGVAHDHVAGLQRLIFAGDLRVDVAVSGHVDLQRAVENIDVVA